MDVRERLQNHINILFSKAPQTRGAFDLKEELLANSIERYDDLRGRGMPEEDAYQSVIGSIGNVEELLVHLPDRKEPQSAAFEEERRSRSALVVTISIGLYFLAGVVFFTGAFLDSYWDNAALLGLIGAIVVCVVPTCMLVYNAYRWPKYEKKEETVVEDFKAYTNDSKKAKSLRGAISSLIWTLTLIVYFAVSFTTMGWGYTWILFLVAAGLEAVVGLIFRIKEL